MLLLSSLIVLLLWIPQARGSGVRGREAAELTEANHPRRALQEFEEVTPSYRRSDLVYQNWNWGTLDKPLRRGQGICTQRTNCFGVTPDGKIIFVIFDSKDNAVAQWMIYDGQTPVYRFVCQRDANMVAYSEEGKPLWSSRTNNSGSGNINVRWRQAKKSNHPNVLNQQAALAGLRSR